MHPAYHAPVMRLSLLEIERLKRTQGKRKNQIIKVGWKLGAQLVALFWKVPGPS